MDGLDRALGWPRLRRLEFSDVESLAAMLKPWGAEITQLGPSGGKSRLVWAQLATLEFRTVSIIGRVHVGGTLPADTVKMQFDLGSDGLRRVGGREVGADEILVGLGGSPVDFTSPSCNNGMNLSLPATLVAAAMNARMPDADLLRRGPIQYLMSNCEAAVERIRGLASAVFGQVEFEASEHAYGAIVDAMVGTLLLPWDRATSAKLRVPHFQRRPLVRRAEEFMRANLAEPLMLHDICAAAHASERAVHYAFRDMYGVGPKQYLALLRLHRVRRDLQVLPPEPARVASTASRYGFWHMGHFSAAYRRLFGETPRRTQARRLR